MDNKTPKILSSLSESDSQIYAIRSQIDEIEGRYEGLKSVLESKKQKLVELKSLRQETADKQEEQQIGLKEEEVRIVERRRQIAALGGVKTARLMEREVDIAARSLQGIEERLLKAFESVEALDNEITKSGEEVDDLELQVKKFEDEEYSKVPESQKEVNKMLGGREKLFTSLSKSLQALYSKVSKRYPGAAVAIAQSGSCRSCYRALPAQLYNQVIVGNLLIQCPGCSRILVYREVPKIDGEEAAPVSTSKSKSRIKVKAGAKLKKKK